MRYLKCLSIVVCEKKFFFFLSPFFSVHLILAGQKKRGGGAILHGVVKSTAVDSLKKKLFHPHIETRVYYHSHNIPKAFFLSFFPLGKIKIYPGRENWCQVEKREDFLWFSGGGFEPSYTRGGDFTPKKKKRNSHDWIRYTRSELRWRGVLGSISSVKKRY